MQNPLSAITYFRRNPGKSLPMGQAPSKAAPYAAGQGASLQAPGKSAPFASAPTAQGQAPGKTLPFGQVPGK